MKKEITVCTLTKENRKDVLKFYKLADLICRVPANICPRGMVKCRRMITLNPLNDASGSKISVHKNEYVIFVDGPQYYMKNEFLHEKAMTPKEAAVADSMEVGTMEISESDYDYYFDSSEGYSDKICEREYEDTNGLMMPWNPKQKLRRTILYPVNENRVFYIMLTPDNKSMTFWKRDIDRLVAAEGPDFLNQSTVFYEGVAKDFDEAERITYRIIKQEKLWVDEETGEKAKFSVLEYFNDLFRFYKDLRQLPILDKLPKNFWEWVNPGNENEYMSYAIKYYHKGFLGLDSSFLSKFSSCPILTFWDYGKH